MTPFVMKTGLPRAGKMVGHTSIKAGSFTIQLEIDRRAPTGGVFWSVDPATCREGDKVPTKGRIDWNPLAVEELLVLVARWFEYDNFLKAEAEIEADPAKYKALAEKQLKAEEKAKADAAEAEREAAERLQAEAEAAAEAERKEQEAAAKAAADAQKRRDAEAKQARLAQIMREAAARELGVA